MLRKKDIARIALLGALARRGVQLSPHVAISAPVEMFAKMLPSLIQTLLQVKASDNITANLRLVGSELTINVANESYTEAMVASRTRKGK